MSSGSSWIYVSTLEVIMPIAWAGIISDGGDLSEDDRKKVRAYLDALGDRVAEALEA